MNRTPLRLAPAAIFCGRTENGAARACPVPVDQLRELRIGREALVHQVRHVGHVHRRVGAMADRQRVLEIELRDALHRLRLHPRRHPELPGLADDDPHRLPRRPLLLQRLVQRRDVRRRLRGPRLPRQRLETLDAPLLVDDPQAVAGEERRVVRQPVAERVELGAHGGRTVELSSSQTLLFQTFEGCGFQFATYPIEPDVG
jgi:hypothetical protein